MRGNERFNDDEPTIVNPSAALQTRRGKRRVDVIELLQRSDHAEKQNLAGRESAAS